MYLFKKIADPGIFQGRSKRRNYFEGWYYKLIDSRMENVLALIPGISMDKAGSDPHAFLQVLDVSRSGVCYLRYDLTAFRFNPDRFEIEIGDNYFSEREICLDIRSDGLAVKGSLTFENIIPYPKTLFRPGIMGPYSFIPFMECYHGIVNIHHEISGQLVISGEEADFSKGYGYIEKDWGCSFPEAWIWLQSNHFNAGDVSLMFSVAKIPWMAKYFIGFISFIRIRDRMFHFATYTRAEIVSLSYKDNILTAVLADRHMKMEITARHSTGGILKAPKNGLMSREILESITAVVKVKLADKSGNTVFEGEGLNTGLEIAGDIFHY